MSQQATVLVVEDDADLREALSDTLELAGLRVIAAADGVAALDCLRDADIRLVVSDVRMARLDGERLLRRIKACSPDLPVVLMTAYGTIESAVQAMRAGASDYLVKPFEAQVLVETVNRFINAPIADDDLVAADPRTRELAALARRVAASEVTVMVTGESGTGKEVFARYIHRYSPRAQGPFVAINCAAIPENMLEATLFGYEKGAFTGAYQARPGKFEQAQNGTLLLDEVSEMPLGLQAKLLRVLQEREVERLGARQPLALDVRVLATSNRNLREEVAAGRFREDLFYRLNVFPLHLPPLRERPADVEILATRLLARHAGGRVLDLGADAIACLRAHDWPGNVRELDNVLQRALILAAGDVLDAQAIRFEAIDQTPDATAPEPPATPDTAPPPAPLNRSVRKRESELILEALRAGRGSRKFAAERLGISPRTLRYKLARLRDAGVAIPG